MKRILIALVTVAVFACSVPYWWPVPSQATIAEVISRNDYTGNGSTTAFTYGFRIVAQADIEVLVDGVTKTLTTDYTVSGVGNPTGTVTFIIAPINGAKIALLRKQPASQSSDYLPNESFPAERIEKDLDKLAMQIQQLRETLGRAIKFEKKSLLKDKDLPDLNAGKFLKTTDAGTGLEWVSPVTVGTLNTPTFTTGSIPFATGTATLGQDNANLFWDDGNNRLGVGTASPGQQLHVAGTARIGGATTLDTSLSVGTTLGVTGATTLSSTLGVTGTVTSTKACATGYTRVGPNFCRATSQLTELNWADATACTARVAHTANPLPADAKMVLIQLDWQALANNGVADRVNTVVSYTDSLCLTLSTSDNYSVWEFGATGAGTVIGRSRSTLLVPLTATNTFRTTQLNAGGNGNADVNRHDVLGYLD